MSLIVSNFFVFYIKSFCSFIKCHEICNWFSESDCNSFAVAAIEKFKSCFLDCSSE